MNGKQCRWGILGTAGIARKNWKAIWNSGNGQLVAVASRTGERAQAFINENQAFVPFQPAPRPMGTYEELLKSDVDAIYIPLPTGIRTEWVIRAADAGKHVLVEKPVGVTAADVQEILTACRRNNVQFMDGVMFMHSKRLDAMRAVLNDGQSVGQIRRIHSHFSFNAPAEFLQSNIRVHGGLEPLGCLGDLGWYNTRLTLWTMNWQMPQRVIGRMLAEARHPDNSQTVPLEFSAEMFFANGVSASFYCSFQTENHQSAQISGTKGYLTLQDFVVPFFGGESAFEVTNNFLRQRGCDFNMEEHTRRLAVAEYSNSEQNSQETNLFRNFATLALSGKPDPFWGDISLKTQQVIDACLTSARNGGKAVDL
jgi:predicted dehydrogenase